MAAHTESRIPAAWAGLAALKHALDGQMIVRPMRPQLRVVGDVDTDTNEGSHA